jgi:outer membrane protein
VSSLALLIVLATTPITLQQVRELSRRNTPALLSQLDYQRAVEQTRIARSAIFPQLTAGADASEIYFGQQRVTAQFPILDMSAQPTGDFTFITRNQRATQQGRHDASVTLTQLFFDGGKWWSQIAQSGAQEDAASGQFLEQQMTSELEGVRRFYVLYGTQRALDVLLDTVKRSKDQLDRAKALYEAGRGSKSDAIQAQVNLGNDQIAAVKQQATIASAQSDLAVWIAFPGSEDVVAQDPGTINGQPSPTPPLADVEQTARDNRPLLKALASQIRAAQAATRVINGAFWPRIFGQGTYLRSGSSLDPVFTDIRLQNQWTIALGLRWELFTGFSTVAASAQAGYSEVTAKLNFEDAQRQIQGDLRRNLRNVEVQTEAAKIAAANRSAAADGLMLAQERFTAGLANTLEVRDAQLKLTQADLSLLQTRIDLEVAREALSRTVGGVPGGAAR